MTTKHCPKCDKTKPVSEFYVKKILADKIIYRSYCKLCGKTDRDAWRKNSSKDNERNKAYNRKHAKEIRGKKLVKNYWPHLTWQEAIAEWNRIYAEQGGHCAMCEEMKDLHVDHRHKPHQVRGLLCYNHNNGLGRFQDDIETLQKAIDYLKKHE